MADSRENKISGFKSKSEFEPRSILLALGVSIPEGGVTINRADEFLLIDALRLMSKNGLRLSSIDNASMDDLKPVHQAITGNREFNESMAEELRYTLRSVVESSGIKILNG
tara:strand:- start:534 stop:866 length:333 start_codon:yes stop_codon:yes gene_type:complete